MTRVEMMRVLYCMLVSGLALAYTSIFLKKIFFGEVKFDLYVAF